MNLGRALTKLRTNMLSCFFVCEEEGRTSARRALAINKP